MALFKLNKMLNSKPFLHELEFNGQKQNTEEDEDADYTGGEEEATNPEETPEDGEDPDYLTMGDEEPQPTEEEPAPEENPDEDTDYTIPDEAEPASDTPEQQPTDDNPTDDDYMPGGEEEPVDGDTEGDPSEGGEEPDPSGGDDYMPGSDDGGEPADGGGDDYTPGGDEEGEPADGGTEGDPSEGGEADGEAPPNELKSTEDELFSDLTDEQKQIQSDELRANFINMYNVVLDIIDKVNNIRKDEATMPVFEFVSSQLLILKDLINTTITRTYDTKTYYENNITYGQCIAILNTVNNLIKEVEKKTTTNSDK